MPHPVLQAMVLADHVYQDRSGKYIIAGTFSRLIGFGSAQQVPIEQPASPDELMPVTGPITRVGSPFLYLALVDVKGECPLVLKFTDLSDASVLFEANIVVTSSDPLAVAEFSIPMPLLPIRGPGNYSLDLLHDGELLGTWRIQANHQERGVL